jgi:hypothetical protein
MVPPTTSGTSNNYQALPSVPSVENKGDARVDQYFSARATAYFRYSHREFQTDNPQIPLPVGSDSSHGFVNIINQQIAGGMTYTIGPTSLLEFRMGYTTPMAANCPPAAHASDGTYGNGDPAPHLRRGRIGARYPGSRRVDCSQVHGTAR